MKAKLHGAVIFPSERQVLDLQPLTRLAAEQTEPASMDSKLETDGALSLGLVRYN